MCVLNWIYYSCVPGTVIFCNHTFLLLARYVLFFWLALKGFCKAKSFAEVSDWISPLLRFLLLRSDCIQRSFCRHPINKDPGQQRKMKPKVAYSIGIQKNHPTSAYDWYPAAKILDCLVEIGCWPTPLNDTPWRPHVSNGFRHPPGHELLTFLAKNGNLTFIPTQTKLINLACKKGIVFRLDWITCSVIVFKI